MKPVTPKLHKGAQLVTFGRSQPELYFALPASVDDQGCVMTEWELSAEDLACVLRGGRVRLWISHTGVNKGAKMTPVKMETIET